MDWSGCRFSAASILASLPSRGEARGVLVREGAIALTRIFGASSAAREMVSPSRADFAEAMDAWKDIP